MRKLTVQIINEFRTPEPLTDVTKCVFKFPYDAGILEKQLGKVVDPVNGLIEIELNDFEIQGLKIGEGQNFKCELHQKNEIMEVIFFKALNVKLNGERKEIYE